MSITNIFKRKDKIITSEGTLKEVTKPVIISVNNKDYIKVQSSSEDVKVYGWTLEVRYKNNDGTSHWYTHWNHRIYQTRESAVDAALKIGTIDREYRVNPLYIMTQPQYRDYKIDKILDNDKPKIEVDVRGWKLKDDYIYHRFKDNKGVETEYKYRKGSVFIQLETGEIVKSGNSNEHTVWINNGCLFKDMIPNGLVDEIVITDEKWLHPHLLRVLKNKFKIK